MCYSEISTQQNFSHRLANETVTPDSAEQQPTPISWTKIKQLHSAHTLVRHDKNRSDFNPGPIDSLRSTTGSWVY